MNKRMFLLLVLILGCGTPEAPKVTAPPLQPTIKTFLEETTSEVNVTVVFLYHYGNWPKVVFNTPEKLQQYKKQVEFMLIQLEAAEKKMAEHEQGTAVKPPQ